MPTHVAALFPTINRDTRPVVHRVSASETPGELPQAVLDLIDNKVFLPRHRRLQREYGDAILLKLAELSHGRDKFGNTIKHPARWYARMTSVKRWPQTLAMVRKLLATARRAVEVMDKLGADPAYKHWYTKQLRAHSEAEIAQWVEQAVKARSPQRLFAWLCVQPSPTG